MGSASHVHMTTGKANLPGLDCDAQAAGAVFDMLDVESTGVLRAHELMAFTSLFDATPHWVLEINTAIVQGGAQQRYTASRWQQEFVAISCHASFVIRQLLVVLR